MKMLTYTLVCLSLAFGACNSETKPIKQNHAHDELLDAQPADHHHTNHNKANKHMHTHSFEDLVQRFESEDRASWLHRGRNRPGHPNPTIYYNR